MCSKIGQVWTPLHHDMFKECLISHSTVRKKMLQLKPVGHQITLDSLTKVALSCYDDLSLTYGQYSLRTSEASKN